jgi:hypothetical protein
MVFPTEVSDDFQGETVPVFPGKHCINRNNSGLYKAGKARPVLLTGVSVRVFLCSSSPWSDMTPHRWMAVDLAPTLPTQPPGPINIRPQDVLSKGKNPTYLCFTHSIEVTPVLQGGNVLTPTVPGNVHVSVPWQENRATLSPTDIPKVTHPYQAFLIQCNLADYIKVLKAHAEYWKGIRYDDKNVTNMRDDEGEGGESAEK